MTQDSGAAEALASLLDGVDPDRIRRYIRATEQQRFEWLMKGDEEFAAFCAQLAALARKQR